MVETKKKLLLISYFFSPNSSVGAKRFSYLSYYFSRNKCEVNVLTVKKKYYQQHDSTLISDGKIYETILIPPYPVKKSNVFKKALNWLWGHFTITLIDSYLGWLIPGLIKGYKIIKESKIDIIIVTGPPFSSFLIAYLLSKFLRIKLILDFRDPWTIYHHSLSALGFKLCKWLEKKFLNYSDALVLNTCKSADFYNKLVSKDKIYVIGNGFDSKMQSINPNYLDKNKIVILYTGNFYGDRKLNYLFEPIQNLYNKGLIKSGSIAIHVFGKLRDDDKDIIERLQLQTLVNEHEKVSYENVVAYMKGADILYLPQGGDVKYSIPFKFFDYLNARKPILAVTSLHSAINDIMQEIECGEIADINDSNSIFNALNKILVEKNAYSFKHIENYSWENISSRYLNIIHSI